MTNCELDVKALAEFVAKDGHSQGLRRKMLREGNLLYGINTKHPNLIQCETEKGHVVLGLWKGGRFNEIFCIL